MKNGLTILAVLGVLSLIAYLAFFRSCGCDGHNAETIIAGSGKKWCKNKDGTWQYCDTIGR